MAIDTPARIAVLGAGPIGLEAALYARFLGYDVELYERGEVAENILQWGHVRMFSPFGLNRSNLGVAANEAQSPGWRPPDDDAILTGREFAESYLLPLAATDLLAGHIHTHTQVVAIGREALLKGDSVAEENRAAAPLRLLSRDEHQHERISTADVVIDASGTFGNHNWLGAGGIPAVGEAVAAEGIEYGLPDVLGRQRADYGGRRVLLVGGGYSAATSAVALVQLAEDAPGTEVIWVTRRTPPDGEGPIRRIPEDRLPERDQLALRAAQLVGAPDGPLRYIPGTVVEGIQRDPSGGRWSVRLTGRTAECIEVDRIIANVGYRPDNSLYGELHVQECYATGGPMRLAAKLASQASADCLDQRVESADSLLTTEPNFYILGAKSYGRNSHFLISVGLDQIRQLFTIIGGRADLDLYSTVQPLRS